MRCASLRSSNNSNIGPMFDSDASRVDVFYLLAAQRTVPHQLMQVTDHNSSTSTKSVRSTVLQGEPSTRPLEV